MSEEEFKRLSLYDQFAVWLAFEAGLKTGEAAAMLEALDMMAKHEPAMRRLLRRKP